ncbi:hypothetical protein COX68_03480 [Candidatus Falkowbacteria bacterium CG_4_10_14_0_2_um_filter_41_15]|uniref:Uncharacterized protein n=4 Tax=Candidatus Falkowiibacteriota TaxID=1752728 RepID=A0A2G9ZMT7_9BACT|nr:MAG: hypothetical protein AUJ35_03065 [Candidatus Falkowbacteria bacterium CG1_02_41_21]PIP34487.1 MAG: hypothetical protein COX21_02640 [Candidatus Falkowbacteria bacterium CG23_combo_of_CG06-09_8_20_14_all_41_10]PIZ11507.1 MAG: hypothetical protein COY54_00225 [Candidatus Falkowbacteria bacterium CG_4_10_14_0_8_um_filter_41_36]PJA09020.1 MAG: hypothetical protein COX68_03480 [Candidatus Falkowbacteria bacterium CG_4_10_14_0_2_um_filter_41_15]
MKKFIGILCLFYLLAGDVSAQTLKMIVDSTKYKISVDYTKTVKKMIAVGKYPWLDNSVNAQNFPLPAKLVGKIVTVSVRTCYFTGDVESDEAIKEINKKGYRLATLSELLAFGAAHSELQKQFSIVALGSVWERTEDSLFAPFLGLHEGGRAIRLHSLSKDWHLGWRFLVVPK